MRSSALNNSYPQLNSSDRTQNLKNKHIYNTAKSESNKPTNYNGSIKYESSSNQVKSVNNYELLTSLKYGQVLCASNCSDTPETQTEANVYSVLIVADNVIYASS